MTGPADRLARYTGKSRVPVPNIIGPRSLPGASTQYNTENISERVGKLARSLGECLQFWGPADTPKGGVDTQSFSIIVHRWSSEREESP